MVKALGNPARLARKIRVLSQQAAAVVKQEGGESHPLSTPSLGCLLQSSPLPLDRLLDPFTGHASWQVQWDSWKRRCVPCETTGKCDAGEGRIMSVELEEN